MNGFLYKTNTSSIKVALSNSKTVNSAGSVVSVAVSVVLRQPLDERHNAQLQKQLDERPLDEQLLDERPLDERLQQKAQQLQKPLDERPLPRQKILTNVPLDGIHVMPRPPA